MSNLKISQLNELTTPLSGDTLPIVNSGETKKITVNNLIGTAISGSINHIAYLNSNNTVTSQQNLYSTNAGNTIGIGTAASTSYQPERLMVDGGGSYNIATFQTSKQDSYAEVNIKNFGSGSNASTDLILWNDVSTESSSYVDLGINSSNYTAGNVGFGGDGYLINASNDLYIGSTQNGSHGHVHVFGGNMWQSSSISVYNDGTIGFGTDWLNNNASTIPTSGYTYEFSGSVKLDNDIKVDGFTVLTNVSSSLNFANDAAAATGGVPLGGLYRNGNFVMIRLT